MKKNFPAFLLCFYATLFACICFSCTLTKNVALNTLSDSLAGSDKRGKTVKIKMPEDSLMSVLTGEEDPVLMGDFFPTALKLYEIVSAQNPTHQGLAVMTGSLYVMYANAFVQMPAEMLDVSQYTLQVKEQKRAKLHYLRGRFYALNALELRYKGCTTALLSGDINAASRYLARLQLIDVPAAYWAGAGWLGAFSVDPLDASLLRTLSCAVALLEAAAALEPDYNNGAVWDVLTAFYALAPAEFGGNTERARFTSEQAFRASKGKLPGPYITYATVFCIPDQDAEGFSENLKKALDIDPDSEPSDRLAVVIAQKKALWLLQHKDDYFIQWD